MQSRTGIDEVDEILERVPRFAETQRMTASLLSGGLTNISFLLEADGERFVVRRSGPNTKAIGIDRSIEARALRRATEAGIAPEAVAFLLPEGHLVTRFVDTVDVIHEDSVKKPGHLRRMAHLLRRVHGLDAIEGSFDPYRDIRRWTDRANQRGIGYSDRAAATFLKAHAIGSQRAGQFDPVLCHNDLYYKNVLDTGDYLLIDWEYAGMGDPFFDLAGLGYLLDEAGKRFLLAEYFGEARAKDIRVLNDIVVVFLAWNVAWSFVQSDVSDINFDYQSFANGMLDLVP